MYWSFLNAQISASEKVLLVLYRRYDETLEYVVEHLDFLPSHAREFDLIYTQDKDFYTVMKEEGFVTSNSMS